MDRPVSGYPDDVTVGAGRGRLGLALGLAALGAELDGHPGARAKHTLK
jgi:hypothetical protein